MKNLHAIILIVLITSFYSFAQQHSGNPAENSSIRTEKELRKISIMYPYTNGKTFNMQYYETTHMPMVAQLLGSNLVKYEIEKGLTSGIPNQPLPFVAIGSFYVRSLDEYREAISPHRELIRADFANYTDISPVILISEIVK